MDKDEGSIPTFLKLKHSILLLPSKIISMFCNFTAKTELSFLVLLGVDFIKVGRTA
jgi:hypothetical protein